METLENERKPSLFPSAEWSADFVKASVFLAKGVFPPPSYRKSLIALFSANFGVPAGSRFDWEFGKFFLTWISGTSFRETLKGERLEHQK